MATAIVLGLITAAMLATSDQQLRDAEALITSKREAYVQAVVYAVKVADSRDAQLTTYYAQAGNVQPTIKARVVDLYVALDKLTARFTTINNAYLIDQVSTVRTAVGTMFDKYDKDKSEVNKQALFSKLAALFQNLEAMKDYIDSWQTNSDQEYYLINRAEAASYMVSR